MLKVVVLLSLVTLLYAVPPHILFIVADDWGWYDVGYHQSDLKTPNIDALAAQGIKLENYYVQPVCTPSRSALMTGRYPLRYGRQHTPIQAAQPTGLFLNETIFPQILQKHGYATHAIGKWHLGIFQWPYTPLYRGFDTHYGYLLGEETYFTHIRNEGGFTGYDFRDQKNVLKSVSGQYSSHLFAEEAARIAKQHDPTKPLFLYVAMQTCHVPLQAPPEYIQRCSYIKDGNRKIYCAMTLTLDEAVKNITDAFIESGLWNNTLLVFTTDNGGLPQGSGYNWPLRGGKGTLWEGGVRGVAFTHGRMLKRPGTENNKLMHMVDWFPTLLDAAGIEYQSAANFPLDGVSAWEAINSVAPNPRSEVVLNIDPLAKNSAVRLGDWKLIQGPQDYSGWYLPGNKTDGLRVDDDNLWLFNISADPNERTNLAEQNPKIVQQLQAIVTKYSQVMVAPWNPPDDPQANPQLHNGTWTPWR